MDNNKPDSSPVPTTASSAAVANGEQQRHYLECLERQLRALYGAVHRGRGSSHALEYRCQGYMQAGLLLGVVSQEQLQQEMERIHRDVAGDGRPMGRFRPPAPRNDNAGADPVDAISTGRETGTDSWIRFGVEPLLES